MPRSMAELCRISDIFPCTLDIWHKGVRRRSFATSISLRAGKPVAQNSRINRMTWRGWRPDSLENITMFLEDKEGTDGYYATSYDQQGTVFLYALSQTMKSGEQVQFALYPKGITLTAESREVTGWIDGKTPIIKKHLLAQSSETAQAFPRLSCFCILY